MKRLLTFSLALTLAFASANATNEPDKPRLVVCIVIDGLQTDHLMTMWNSFNKGGFRKLYGQGAVCRNTYYPILPAGNAGDYATIVSGTTPFYHGITGSQGYDLKTGRLGPTLTDPSASGIGTFETVSPKSLLSTTVSDELKINSGGKSKAYSVALNSSEALMLAGHAADGAVWISQSGYNFASTSFYPAGLPRWADQMNVDHTIEKIIDTDWIPLYSIGSYMFPPRKRDAAKGFVYFNTGSNPDEKTATFKRSPFVNQLVKDAALSAITTEKLGASGNTDYLGLEFTLQIPGDDSFELLSAEKEDMYLRLDNYLSELLERIETTVGSAHTLIVVTGTQGENHSQGTLNNNRIPTGQFVPKNSMALLNLYLMAIYGQSQWVTGYYNKNIYLDRASIEKKGIPLPEIQRRCATFMLELQGVQTAYPAIEIIESNAKGNDEQARMKNSYNKNHSGDVIFTLMPGWIEAAENGVPTGGSNRKESYVPLIFWGYNIKPQTITSASITDIAPTLCYMLHISSPNACVGKAIQLTENVEKR
jgi:hypothetical protein